MPLSTYNIIYIPAVSVTENCIRLLGEHNKLPTLQHVTNVARTSTGITRRFGLDEHKVSEACWLHDISVLIPKADHFGICDEYDIDVLDAEWQLPLLLHQKVSRLIASAIFGVTDGEILSVIECHTTLKANPSDIDMAVFIADKLAWDQSGEPPFCACVTEALETSLGAACLEYMDYCLENGMFLVSHPWLLEAKRWLEGQAAD